MSTARGDGYRSIVDLYRGWVWTVPIVPPGVSQIP